MTPSEIEVVTEMIKDEVKAQAGAYLNWVDITDTEYTAFAIKVLRRIDDMRKPPAELPTAAVPKTAAAKRK